ncbi:DNA-binding protein, partial [Pseudomonas syringae]|nr:DNA-binding protein [Pseudomonas syringae]
MTLLLNGEQIIGHRMKLTASLKIEADELGGQTSATDKSHKGFKPKTLTVALTIP